LQVVITKSFARIHWQNLVNFGIVPLNFANPADYEKISAGDTLVLSNLPQTLKTSHEIVATIEGTGTKIPLTHKLSQRQVDVVIDGGLINWAKKHPPK
jgi:aconitate hydratase